VRGKIWGRGSETEEQPWGYPKGYGDRRQGVRLWGDLREHVGGGIGSRRLFGFKILILSDDIALEAFQDLGVCEAKNLLAVSTEHEPGYPPLLAVLGGKPGVAMIESFLLTQLSFHAAYSGYKCLQRVRRSKPIPTTSFCSKPKLPQVFRPNSANSAPPRPKLLVLLKFIIRVIKGSSREDQN